MFLSLNLDRCSLDLDWWALIYNSKNKKIKKISGLGCFNYWFHCGKEERRLWIGLASWIWSCSNAELQRYVGGSVLSVFKGITELLARTRKQLVLHDLSGREKRETPIRNWRRRTPSWRCKWKVPTTYWCLNISFDSLCPRVKIWSSQILF